MSAILSNVSSQFIVAYLYQDMSSPQIVLGISLRFHVDAAECILLDLQLSLNRVDKERQFAPASRIQIGRALHLPRAQGHPHFGENPAGLFEVDITRLLHCTTPPVPRRRLGLASRAIGTAPFIAF